MNVSAKTDTEKISGRFICFSLVRHAATNAAKHL
jgi:hypothetical protein